MNKQHWRKPTHDDLQLIMKLLDVSFTGRTNVLNQIALCQVNEFDDNGSLEFIISNEAIPAKVLHRIPVEGVFTDSDGIIAHALMHIVNGIIKEIEIYKEDNSKVVDKQRFTTMTVTSLG